MFHELFEQRGNRKNRIIFLFGRMRVNFLGDSHDHGIREVGDAARPTAVFFLVHAVPGNKRKLDGFVGLVLR